MRLSIHLICIPFRFLNVVDLTEISSLSRRLFQESNLPVSILRRVDSRLAMVSQLFVVLKNHFKRSFASSLLNLRQLLTTSSLLLRYTVRMPLTVDRISESSGQILQRLGHLFVIAVLILFIALLPEKSLVRGRWALPRFPLLTGSFATQLRCNSLVFGFNFSK